MNLLLLQCVPQYPLHTPPTRSSAIHEDELRSCLTFDQVVAAQTRVGTKQHNSSSLNYDLEVVIDVGGFSVFQDAALVGHRRGRGLDAGQG